MNSSGVLRSLATAASRIAPRAAARGTPISQGLCCTRVARGTPILQRLNCTRVRADPQRMAGVEKWFARRRAGPVVALSEA